MYINAIWYNYLPEGTSTDDHMLRSILSDLRGGQFMTGKTVLPESTGPKPLLRPATAISTTYSKKKQEKTCDKWK